MHFLSLREFDSDRILDMVNLGLRIAKGDVPRNARLDGKTVGLLFLGPSTRTRTAFGVGAMKLGGSLIQYGPLDLQIKTGETWQDCGTVLSEYLDALVVRTNDRDENLRALAVQQRMSIINAMSKTEHPTQAIGDLITIKESTGGLSNRRIVYIGEGNNTAAALTFAVALMPRMELFLFTPRTGALDPDVLAEAQRLAADHNSEIVEEHDLPRKPARADVVYTTRWETMGVAHKDPSWREAFRPFKVTQQLFDAFNTRGDTIFMHDLPTIRDEDCDSGLLDGPRSVAFRQAFHKMTAAMAILGRCTATQVKA